MIRKYRPWAFIAAALVIASSVYATRSIEADEQTPGRPSPTTPGPQPGDGERVQIPGVEGRFVHGVTSEEYGDVICEQDANVEVSMDGRVVKITQQSNSDRLPVQVGEQANGFHEMHSLLLEDPWINPEGVDDILDTPSYEKYRERGTLRGAVYRDEEGTLHWGCEAWLPSGDELPSIEERQRQLIDKINALGCERPFCQ